MTRGLDAALYALLFDAEARAAFFAGDLARFELTAEDEAALVDVHREQLASAASLAREHVFARRQRGSGSLAEVFRETIDDWKACHPESVEAELESEFVASNEFRACHMTASTPASSSLEEAFYRFAEARGIGEPATRLRECAMGLLRGLAAMGAPAFTLPTFVRRAPRGYLVVSPHGPTLFALVGTQFVTGPITPHIAALLDPDQASAAHTVVGEDDVRAQLVRMGLLPDRSEAEGETRTA